LCAEHYGAPYDLLAAALGAQPARLPAITARWRAAGFAATGRLGPGPGWCWLTPADMDAAGFGYRAGRPSRPGWRTSAPCSSPGCGSRPSRPGARAPPGGQLDDASPALIEALVNALDIQILYRPEQDQATIWATLNRHHPPPPSPPCSTIPA